MKFEWDPVKARSNQLKHGVSFERAAFVFADKLNITIFDSEHSGQENRWITVGQVAEEILVVVHTYPLEPDETTIRILSARMASAREKSYYQEGVR